MSKFVDLPDVAYKPLARLGVLYQCARCGAAVSDQDQHSQFHTNLTGFGFAMSRFLNGLASLADQEKGPSSG